MEVLIDVDVDVDDDVDVDVDVSKAETIVLLAISGMPLQHNSGGYSSMEAPGTLARGL